MDTKAIISFNIAGFPLLWHARARLLEVARQVEATGADIINLQELHTYDLLRTLRRHLTSFPHVAYQSGIAGPRGGLVTLSKTPLHDRKYFALGGHKGILVTCLTGRSVVLNVHLVANTDGDWSRTNRFYPKHKAQLDRVLEIAKVYEAKSPQILLSGDFNLAKTCDLYEYFVQAGEWQDAFRDSHEPTFHGEFLSPGRQPQCIDYIFAKGEVGFDGARLVFKDKMVLGNGQNRYLSNHVGLYATFAPDKPIVAKAK
jgi:exonuclease III